MCDPDSSSGWNIRHESEGRGSSPPQVETIFVSKISTLSQEHPFVCRKWMPFARALLAFEMLTLLQFLGRVHIFSQGIEQIINTYSVECHSTKN